MSTLSCELAIKTVSLLNKREHWRVTAARKKAHRAQVALILRSLDHPTLPVVCRVTRRSTGVLDSHDNLPSAFKNVIDEVAKWLGIDDADPRVRWEYAQEKCKKGDYGIRIEFFEEMK